MTGSNTAEAEEAADPSSEAEDSSCWVTATGVSVAGVTGELPVASETGETTDKCYMWSPGRSEPESAGPRPPGDTKTGVYGGKTDPPNANVDRNPPQ